MYFEIQNSRLTNDLKKREREKEKIRIEIYFFFLQSQIIQKFTNKVMGSSFC